MMMNTCPPAPRKPTNTSRRTQANPNCVKRLFTTEDIMQHWRANRNNPHYPGIPPLEDVSQQALVDEMPPPPLIQVIDLTQEEEQPKQVIDLTGDRPYWLRQKPHVQYTDHWTYPLVTLAEVCDIAEHHM
jgi:hypothetical protein